MQQINSNLQTKINNNQVNNLNEKNDVQFSNLSSKPDTVELNVNDKKKKKAVKIAAIIITILVGAVGFGVLAHKGKLGNKAKEFIDGFLGKFKGKTVSTDTKHTKVEPPKQETATHTGSGDHIEIEPPKQETATHTRSDNHIGGEPPKPETATHTGSGDHIGGEPQIQSHNKPIKTENHGEINLLPENLPEHNTYHNVIEEANQRIEVQRIFEQNAREAQARFNRPFEATLSNKSANESTEVLKENLIKQECKQSLRKARHGFNKDFYPTLQELKGKYTEATRLAEEYKKNPTSQLRTQLENLREDFSSSEELNKKWIKIIKSITPDGIVSKDDWLALGLYEKSYDGGNAHWKNKINRLITDTICEDLNGYEGISIGLGKYGLEGIIG